MVCAIAIIDQAATDRLVEALRTAERFGFPAREVHGHITLATYMGDDEAGFISSCKEILSKHGRFPVHYDKIEAWGTTSGTGSFIVAVPRKEAAIYAIQKKISGEWSAYLNRWTQPDAWNPHTFLLYRPGVNLDAAAAAMQAEFEPFVTQISRVEFTRVHDDDESVIDAVDFIELK